MEKGEGMEKDEKKPQKDGEGKEQKYVGEEAKTKFRKKKKKKCKKTQRGRGGKDPVKCNYFID